MFYILITGWVIFLTVWVAKVDNESTRRANQMQEDYNHVINDLYKSVSDLCNAGKSNSRSINKLRNMVMQVADRAAARSAELQDQINGRQD